MKKRGAVTGCPDTPPWVERPLASGLQRCKAAKRFDRKVAEAVKIEIT